LVDTHFANPIGLDDPAQYTSAADLARASIGVDDAVPGRCRDRVDAEPDPPRTATHHAYALYNLNQADPHLRRRDRAEDRLDRTSWWLLDCHRHTKWNVISWWS